jgi:hypothetical protein
MFKRRVSFEDNQAGVWVETKCSPKAVASKFCRKFDEILEHIGLAEDACDVYRIAYIGPSRGGRLGIDQRVFLKLTVQKLLHALKDVWRKVVLRNCGQHLEQRSAHILDDGTFEAGDPEWERESIQTPVRRCIRLRPVTARGQSRRIRNLHAMAVSCAGGFFALMKRILQSTSWLTRCRVPTEPTQANRVIFFRSTSTPLIQITRARDSMGLQRLVRQKNNESPSPS